MSSKYTSLAPRTITVVRDQYIYLRSDVTPRSPVKSILRLLFFFVFRFVVSTYTGIIIYILYYLYYIYSFKPRIFVTPLAMYTWYVYIIILCVTVFVWNIFKDTALSFFTGYMGHRNCNTRRSHLNGLHSEQLNFLLVVVKICQAFYIFVCIYCVGVCCSITRTNAFFFNIVFFNTCGEDAIDGHATYTRAIRRKTIFDAANSSIFPQSF